MEIVNQILPRLLGVFLTALGTWILAYFVRSHRLALASQRWPRAQGTITESITDVRECEGSRTYSPKIKYTYKVDGKVYQGNTLTYRPLKTSKKVVATIVKALSEGQPVDVYYDPSEPSRAVLLPGPATDNAERIAFTVAAAIAVAGLALAIVGPLENWFGR